MQITLQQLSPAFLTTDKTNGSTLWNRDLVFQGPERIQIIAPSGSGKSSFIHFLYGVRKDYNGQILFNNKAFKNFNAENMAALRSAQLSIVFQDLRLFAEHTVLENILIKNILNPFYETDRIKEMAERLGIGDKLNQQANICSYGEQQRIAIIRALQQPFDFILLDEPFSHLDIANSHKAMDLIEEEAQKRNAGIILADLAEVPFFKADKTFNL